MLILKELKLKQYFKYYKNLIKILIILIIGI